MSHAPSNDPALIIGPLKRLKVSPTTDAQRQKQRRIQQRQFRAKLQFALQHGQLDSLLLRGRGQGRGQESSSSPPTSLYASDSPPSFLVRPSRLNPNITSLLPKNVGTSLDDSCLHCYKSQSLHHRRHRHASESGASSSSAASSPLQSLVAAENKAFGAVALATAQSTQSLQDFSRCCSKLETFSITESRRRKREGESFNKIQNRWDVQNISDEETSEPTVTTSSLVTEDEDDVNVRTCCPSSSCAQQARKEYQNDVSVNDLAGYLEDSVVFPKKMSYMAEMMYT